MLKLRPTYEEMLREARTHRLKILPEKQKRTQQGILLDDVDFDDFDLGKHDRKEILSNNPEKGTQTDLFDKMYSTKTSESMKSLDKETIKSEEVESEPAQKQEPQRERGKPMLRQVYDNLFGEDEFKEEREEMRNIRQQIDEDEEEPIEEQQIEVEIVEEGEEGLAMNVKKSYEASSSSSSSSRRSSTNRSALLPIEEEALSEYIQPSPPVTVQSSVRSDARPEHHELRDASLEASGRMSDRTVEYVENLHHHKAL